MSRGGPAGVFLAATLLVIVLSTAAAPSSAAHASLSSLGATAQIDPDTVQIDVSLAPDGDADWEIRYRVLLDDDNTTAAFESLEQDVAENRSDYANQFATRINGTVMAAENATGREMAARNVSVRTSRQEIPQRYGLLVYSFEWTSFAVIDGQQVRAGDAIGGLYLDDSTSLTIHWPTGYSVVAADPAPDDSGARSATWRGPAEFTTEQPRLAVTSAAPSETNSGDPASQTSTPPLAIAGFAAVLLLSLLVASGWWYRGRQPDDPSSPTATPPSSNSEPAPPEELLSNEERVLRLLAERGGRMKQQQVVEALGWTDAKTSQVVGDMRESGAIEGFRLGRENVLRLPESDDEPSESQ